MTFSITGSLREKKCQSFEKVSLPSVQENDSSSRAKLLRYV